MGTLNLTHTLTPGTPENVNHVQQNFEDVRDYINNGNVGPSNLEVMPVARVYNSANISLTTATITPLTFDSERVDPTGMHSTASNTGRLTVATDGIYLISGHVRIAAAANGTRSCFIRLNGSTIIGRTDIPGLSTNVSYISTQAIYRLNATEYVELCAYQDSGGALNCVAEGNVSPEFSIALLSRIT